jgi:hypothetical protein
MWSVICRVGRLRSGAEHVVIVGPIRSRKNTGIVVVNSQGAVTSIPTYEADAVAQTRDGLQLAAVFVPIIADTEREGLFSGKSDSVRFGEVSTMTPMSPLCGAQRCGSTYSVRDEVWDLSTGGVP